VSGGPDADRYAAWLAADPDASTRRELHELIGRADAGDETAWRELADAFAGGLGFGTAGVRGALGPGPNRMNRLVVRRITLGVVHWLATEGHGGGTVVVGYDGRRNSDVFAADTAGVLAAHGFTPVLYDRPVPTPVLAFAARVTGAVAAVMITASHNPATDNGYKLYDATGSQILPTVAARIEAVIRARTTSADGEPAVRPVAAISPEPVLTAYRDRVLRRLGGRTEGRDRVRVVYSAMHGVGGETFSALCAAAGFDDVHPVLEQHRPDGGFPTTRFPNPEEPGALDLAVRRAVSVNADLIVAHDPDADRCAVAVPDPAGGYRRLSGDTVGALLLWWLVRSGKLPAGATVASSVVSSELLATMAARYGLHHETTLTGFKWIARVPGLRYGYEEAIGYCLDPQAVGDKDGISAAVEVCELAAALRAEGRDLVWAIEQIDAVFGAHRQLQLTVPSGSPEEGSSLCDRLLAVLPAQLAGLGVVDAHRLDEPGRLPEPTVGVVVSLAGEDGATRGRLLVRPSGTEPKTKVYLEVVAADGRSAEQRLVVLRDGLTDLLRDRQP